MISNGSVMVNLWRKLVHNIINAGQSSESSFWTKRLDKQYKSTFYPSAVFLPSVLPVSSNICLSSALRCGASQHEWPSRLTLPSHLLFSCSPAKGSSRRAVPSGKAPGFNAQQGPLLWHASAPPHHYHIHISMQHAARRCNTHPRARAGSGLSGEAAVTASLFLFIRVVIHLLLIFHTLWGEMRKTFWRWRCWRAALNFLGKKRNHFELKRVHVATAKWRLFYDAITYKVIIENRRTVEAVVPHSTIISFFNLNIMFLISLKL